MLTNFELSRANAATVSHPLNCTPCVRRAREGKIRSSHRNTSVKASATTARRRIYHRDESPRQTARTDSTRDTRPSEFFGPRSIGPNDRSPICIYHELVARGSERGDIAGRQTESRFDQTNRARHHHLVTRQSRLSPDSRRVGIRALSLVTNRRMRFALLLPPPRTPPSCSTFFPGRGPPLQKEKRHSARDSA